MADYPLINGGSLDRGHRIGTIVVAALLVTLGVACLPFSRVQLAAEPGFMPAFGAITLLVDGLTAGLLFAQARLSRRRSMLRLGAAYLFAATITVSHLLAFPGAVSASPIIGTGGSAVWLWCAWHGGFAVCIIRFAWGGDGPLKRADIRRSVTCTGLAVAALTGIATAGLPWLPELIRGSDYGGLITTGIGPLVLALMLVAEFLVITRLRCKDVLSLWLTIALLAACLDVELTLSGAGRFTLGWYAARALSLMTGVSVLFGLLSELMREAGRVADANAQLEQMLQTDVLTGLANRRAFEQTLAAEWRRAQREQTAISLLMVDIDWFKGFNDRYGHPAGDGCLRSVGAALAGQAYRPADLPARIGGEEFGIILPVTEEAGAVQVAERLRASVASLGLRHEGSSSGTVTISIGTATIRPYSLNCEASELMDAADHALYQAKALGRNAVCCCERTPPVLAQV